jgi:hypothetical protein
MREDFLSFIWQFQYFDAHDLTTSDGKSLQIISAGSLNQDAGPDFEFAKILIEDIDWAGNVEIHLKASDWQQHRHEQNIAYNNVILHVVWEENQAIRRNDETSIPTLILKNRVNPKMLYSYQSLQAELGDIPCHRHFAQVKSLYHLTMLDKALIQRLEKKGEHVLNLWEANQKNWEETAYQLLAQNFGFKTNAAPFLRLAQNLPLKVLQKHRGDLSQIEALLFGQAGFLKILEEDDAEDYPKNIKKEYQFLAKKYELNSHIISEVEWKFLRMRPPNFPTIRIAQFAQLINQTDNLFAKLIQGSSEELKKDFRIKQSSYWQTHYHFAKPATKTVSSLGLGSIENIIINTAVPLLAAYSQAKDQSAYMEQAILHLENLPAENNKILKMWGKLGLKVKTAFDSQALLELHKSYCLPKRCLSCTIGTSIVREGNN